ncbi:unnamed protein product [Amoebophrya sp. A120]|nr:unnamed protein product [Amoebophrya sp. A120]|eukprot:GSA120T00021349001.1
MAMSHLKSMSVQKVGLRIRNMGGKEHVLAVDPEKVKTVADLYSPELLELFYDVEKDLLPPASLFKWLLVSDDEDDAKGEKGAVESDEEAASTHGEELLQADVNDRESQHEKNTEGKDSENSKKGDHPGEFLPADAPLELQNAKISYQFAVVQRQFGDLEQLPGEGRAEYRRRVSRILSMSLNSPERAQEFFYQQCYLSVPEDSRANIFGDTAAPFKMFPPDTPLTKRVIERATLLECAAQALSAADWLKHEARSSGQAFAVSFRERFPWSVVQFVYQWSGAKQKQLQLLEQALRIYPVTSEDVSKLISQAISIWRKDESERIADHDGETVLSLFQVGCLKMFMEHLASRDSKSKAEILELARPLAEAFLFRDFERFWRKAMQLEAEVTVDDLIDSGWEYPENNGFYPDLTEAPLQYLYRTRKRLDRSFNGFAREIRDGLKSGVAFWRMMRKFIKEWESPMGEIQPSKMLKKFQDAARCETRASLFQHLGLDDSFYNEISSKVNRKVFKQKFSEAFNCEAAWVPDRTDFTNLFTDKRKRWAALVESRKAKATLVTCMRMSQSLMRPERNRTFTLLGKPRNVAPPSGAVEAENKSYDGLVSCCRRR